MDVDERRLRATTNARVWAEEFAKIYPDCDYGPAAFAAAVELLAHPPEPEPERPKWRPIKAPQTRPLNVPHCPGFGNDHQFPPGSECGWCGWTTTDPAEANTVMVEPLRPDLADMPNEDELEAALLDAARKVGPPPKTREQRIMDAADEDEALDRAHDAATVWVDLPQLADPAAAAAAVASRLADRSRLR